MSQEIDVKTLTQATTDGMTSLALVVARMTDKEQVGALLTRYSNALEQTGENAAGAQLVGEMARVVGQIKD